MKSINPFAIIIFLIGLCGPVATVHAVEPKVSASVSPRGFLNADGTLRLNSGLRGSLDIQGYNVRLDPKRGPVFSSAPIQSQATALATVGNWAAIGHGGGAVDGIVRGMASDGNGNLYIVGDFTNVANIANADYVAKWNGTSWLALGDNGFGDGSLKAAATAVAIDGSGNLYVGGYFTSVSNGGTVDSNASNLAKWNGSAWSAIGSQHPALNGAPNAIAVHGSDVYVGGSFTNVVPNNGIPLGAADHVAEWNGSDWVALGSNGGGDGAFDGSSYVNALAVDSSGNLYVGGSFQNVSDNGTSLTAADNIAEWNGSHWVAVGGTGGGTPDGSINGTVYALAADGTGNVYAGGGFTDVNNNGTIIYEADYLAMWNGSNWSALGNSGIGHGSLNSSVDAILIDGSNVYVGGSFANAENNGVAVPAADYVAKWSGGQWSALGNNGAGDGSIANKGGSYVSSLALLGADPVVGGAFYDLNNAGTVLPQADYVAEWSSSSSFWSTLGNVDNGALANGYASSEVDAIAVNGSNIYVGGRFFDISNAGINMPAADLVVKWDGSNWSALGDDGSGGASVQGSWVYALALDSAGNLYVGGSFSHVNNHGTDLPNAQNIAEWDGTNWSALGNSGLLHGSLNGAVDAIAINGSNVYVGGSFTDAENSGVAVPAADYVAKWDGSTWSALGSNGVPGDGSLNAGVSAIAISGTDVYVGGNFTSVNSNGTAIPEAAYVARWDGANWSSLGNGGAGIPSLNSLVDAIAVNGSKVYVGGAFSNVRNGAAILSAADDIAMWDGANWSALGADCSGDGALGSRVDAIAIDSTGVYATGFFEDVHDGCTTLNAADRIARWDGTHWWALGSNGAGNGAIPSPSLAVLGNALAVDGTDLLVGGSFSNVNNNGTLLPAADYIAAYGMKATATAMSQGVNDGWVLESGPTTNLGGTVLATAPTLQLGDDASNEQYRSILSFKTGPALPDNAVIMSVTLRLRRQGLVGTGNPMTMLGGLLVDMKKGFFGSSAALQIKDFQAKPAKSYGPFKPALKSGWYSLDLTPAGGYINKVATAGGLTQIRLRFKTQDNGDSLANYLSLFSGNAKTASRPQLIITYYIP